jgi:hypothetical protein
MKLWDFFWGKGRRLEPIGKHQDPADARRQAVAQVAKLASGELKTRFYLYFPDKAAADAAGSVIAEEGYEVEVGPSGVGSSYLVLAITRMEITERGLEEMSARFEKIAEACGGELDGWEAEIPR